MGATLHYLAMIEYDDLLGVLHRRETVTKYDTCALRAHFAKMFKNATLRSHIDRRQGIVKNQNWRIQ